MNKIAKIVINQNGQTVEYDLAQTTLDSIVDTLSKITTSEGEVDNPSYNKTLRQILAENEEVEATALNDLNLRLLALENAQGEEGTVSSVEFVDTSDTKNYDNLF